MSSKHDDDASTVAGGPAPDREDVAIPEAATPPGFDDAVRLLAGPKTWCEGAARLVAMRDPRALVPLMHAYRARAELGKKCLYEAMEALGSPEQARALMKRPNVEERRTGIRLAEIFYGDEQLAALEQAASDQDPELRAEAARVLSHQPQTAAWEAVMVRLLDASDANAQMQAIESLSTRYTDSARKALQDRLSRETDAGRRAALVEALKKNVSRH